MTTKGTVLVSGSTGLVGRALVSALTSKQYKIVRLVRSRAVSDRTSGTVFWDPKDGTIDLQSLSSHSIDTVVHLAGENIFGLWSKKKKKAIVQSRVKGTELLSESLASLDNPPKALLSASAIGYYGDRPGEELTERSTKGEGFLAETSEAWERATKPAEEAGVRTLHLRIGIVMTPLGGALKMMIPPFRFGLGGRLGSGKQIVSWIALEDLVSIIIFGIENGALSGPINCTAPNPVSNQELTKILGAHLGRPTPFPVPAILLKALPGGFARETILASVDARPKKLLEEGFKFQYSELSSRISCLSN